MNTKIKIYLGAPIEIQSELLFLNQLTVDLNALGKDALIFANFHLPLGNPSQQIDFLVILDQLVCHVELKSLSAPLFGGPNGEWQLKMPDGTFESLERKNPFKQALDCKFAISDAMHHFWGKDGRPDSQSKKKFYTQIESAVCIFPNLCKGSEVVSNHQVRVLGYPKLLELFQSKKLSPGWSLDDWKSFAMKLGLVLFEAERSSTDLAIENASRAVTDYERRLREIYNHKLPEIVPTTVVVDGQLMSSNSVVSCLATGGHVQFNGPSGCGKSHHAIHSSLKAMEAGRLPLITNAKNYRGKLSNLLNESIAHLHPGSALDFFEVARLAGKSIALVIDGFNECPKDLQQSLLKDLLAVYVRWRFPMLLTAQDKLEMPSELSGATVKFNPPDKAQRLQLLSMYANDVVDEKATDLCAAFTTSLELRLAGECFKNLAGTPTRAALFDSYLRLRCCDKVDVSLTRLVLSSIADSMRRKLQSSLSVSEVWEIGERVIEAQEVCLTTLQAILQVGFVEFQHGACSFRHEMFQRYFEAVAIRRSAKRPQLIAEELKKPQNFELAEFLLGMTTTPEDFKLALEAASKSNAKLVTESLLGSYGDLARSVVVADAKAVLEAANVELSTLDARAVKSEFNSKEVAIEVSTASDFNGSPYHKALINSIGAALPHGLFVDEVFRLISSTESKLMESLKQKHGEVVGRAPFLSALVHQLYVLRGPKQSLPAFYLSGALDGCFRCDVKPHVIEYMKGQLTDLEHLSLGELYLILDLLDDDASTFEAQVPSLLRHCWESGVYHIQLKILRRIATWGALKWRSYESRDRAPWIVVVNMLQSFETSNIMLSSQLVETLFAFDLLAPPFSADEVSRELQSILADFDSEESRDRAYSAVTNVFEEIFSDAFYEAINALTSSERTRLYTMAALAMPSYSMSASFILSELMEHCDPISLPAFRRFAAELDAESICPQDTTSGFILGFTGCARFMEFPPSLSDLTTSDREAWQVFGEIFFWMEKLGTCDEMTKRCRPLWEKLSCQLVFEAVDPLKRFAHATTSIRSHQDNPVQLLFVEFQDEIRNILKLVIKRPDALTSIDRRINPCIGVRSQLTFIINTLGQLGDEQTVAMLTPYIDDEYHGEDAMIAIRRIRKGEPFKSLEVVFRFP